MARENTGLNTHRKGGGEGDRAHQHNIYVQTETLFYLVSLLFNNNYINLSFVYVYTIHRRRLKVS